MKRDINKAFDRELKKELNRGRRVWFLLALAIVFVLVVYTPIFNDSVPGEIIEIEEWDRGGTPSLRIKVKLETGKEVIVTKQNEYKLVTGMNVDLAESKSLFGMTTYQYIGIHK